MQIACRIRKNQARNYNSCNSWYEKWGKGKYIKEGYKCFIMYK
jgi:hypothetical protein